jgi:uncharacterized membrane protein
MAHAGPGAGDERAEQVLGNLLRAGVILAAAVVLAGGALYLARHGTEPRDRFVYHDPGDSCDLCSPAGIVREALSLTGRGIIQLGLLLLVATPIARVLGSVLVFARQRDRTYVVLTLIVLGVLLYSLFLG